MENQLSLNMQGLSIIKVMRYKIILLVILLLVGLGLLVGLLIKSRNNNILQNSTNTSAFLQCKSHFNCPFEITKDCGGELCAPEYKPYCDNGGCRTPRNDNEWEIACRDKSELDKKACFKKIIESNKNGIDYTFGLCSRNFSITDEIESCKLLACGYDAVYPEISPGESSCVRKAISSTCTDGRKNGRESGIDCGGPDCKPCSNSTSCSSNSDCKSGICNLNGIEYQNKCVDICPDGPIKKFSPCGCQVLGNKPQGYEKKSIEDWEKQYGNGKTLFCCSGMVKQLMESQNCSQ